jgi:hypothetical protein
MPFDINFRSGVLKGDVLRQSCVSLYLPSDLTVDIVSSDTCDEDREKCDYARSISR